MLLLWSFQDPVILYPRDLTLSNGVQARMSGTMFRSLDGYPSVNPISALVKDYLKSSWYNN
ncbi:hypothetical protein TSUD_205020 [Trifolium subterraneum]|uniref:Uncharacterized protein n=1 Tax=Trifolium subterraneum TaxID=3900 RepID=A0A2Z6MSX8_TRISU|nr:hypothetical protein TSUD_205020 [Trifolium subterraneum]